MYPIHDVSASQAVVTHETSTKLSCKMHSISTVVNIGYPIPSHVIVEHATALKQSCCDLMSGSRNCDSTQEGTHRQR